MQVKDTPVHWHRYFSFIHSCRATQAIGTSARKWFHHPVQWGHWLRVVVWRSGIHQWCVRQSVAQTDTDTFHFLWVTVADQRTKNIQHPGNDSLEVRRRAIRDLLMSYSQHCLVSTWTLADEIQKCAYNNSLSSKVLSVTKESNLQD